MNFPVKIDAIEQCVDTARGPGRATSVPVPSHPCRFHPTHHPTLAGYSARPRSPASPGRRTGGLSAGPNICAPQRPSAVPVRVGSASRATPRAAFLLLHTSGGPQPSAAHAPRSEPQARATAQRAAARREGAAGGRLTPGPAPRRRLGPAGPRAPWGSAPPAAPPPAAPAPHALSYAPPGSQQSVSAARSRACVSGCAARSVCIRSPS